MHNEIVTIMKLTNIKNHCKIYLSIKDGKMNKMNSTKEAALLMSSLSIYKGILNRTVPKAYFELLCASDKSVFEFTQAWGNFFSLLCDRGYADSLAKCLTETALFDENAFSKSAAAKKEQTLSTEAVSAVRRDISAIIRISSITPEQILNDYSHRDELGSVAHSLPRWKTGTPISEFSDEEHTIDCLADYYRKNGCGMFARYRAFIWRDKGIEPVVHPDNISIDTLKGYDIPRGLVVDNTTAFLNGIQCNNCLLYGDRGTGKSSTVKAILNRYYKDGLRMVEMPKDRLGEFPVLADKIAALPLKFIIFIDDLSFSSDDKSYAQLKAVLEGGLAARPDNTLIYATSNRRHLVKENLSDRNGDELHRNDSIQESLSLSDRFGLSINFSKPDKESYLQIVRSLAREKNLNISIEELEKGAEQWAIERGGRSPRCARQYISIVEARLKN